MPYQFDCESLADLLDDVQKLPDVASRLEGMLGRLVAIDTASTAAIAPLSVAGELNNA